MGRGRTRNEGLLDFSPVSGRAVVSVMHEDNTPVVEDPYIGTSVKIKNSA